MSKDRESRRRPNKTISGSKPIRGLLGHWRVFLALLPIAIVAGLAVGAVRSSFFTVREVRVNGVEALDPVQLVATSGLLGESMLDLPKSEAKDRLLADPQVKAVSISRRWPHALLLEIEERRPEVLWSVDGIVYLVDAEGYVISAGTLPAGAPSIVQKPGTADLSSGDRVHPDAVALALHVAASSPTVSGRPVTEFQYSAGVGMTLILGDGLQVTVGDLRSYDYKLAVLDELLTALAAQGVSPSRVDLRFGERVIYE